MTTRFKTFREFQQSIKVVHRPVIGGVAIICTLDRSIVLKTLFKPWNSEATRRSFLARLYVEKIFARDMSPKIRRPEKYELLGKRCIYHNDLCVIVHSVQVVETGTGEVDEQLTLFCLDNKFRSSPFKILKSQCKI